MFKIGDKVTAYAYFESENALDVYSGQTGSVVELPIDGRDPWFRVNFSDPIDGEISYLLACDEMELANDK